MPELILIRHGESVWNRESRFTGWADVTLTERGMEETRTAARRMRDEGFSFDVAYTSLLKRAIKTLWIVMEEMDRMWVPIRGSWRLNERHYGALQGRTHAEVDRQAGPEQALEWRRRFDLRPPALDDADERYPGHDDRYRGVDRNLLPRTESLKDTVERVLPYWRDVIAPSIAAGRRALISAHGNSLRALVKYLEGISDEGIEHVEIPTARFLVYEFDQDLKVRGRH